jgi:hypothetical protein
LPRQHSLVHYRLNIQELGAPSGLCSSITESWHNTAVKKPWWRSSCFDALGQMLLTNQHLDKLNAVRADFISCGMLLSEHQAPTIVDDKDNDGGPIDERVLADFKLARIRGASFNSKIILYISDLISRADISHSIVLTRDLH